ncbi:hypothetical protein CEXT_783141 [Caerostris extrusa]|uniref:Uncharacterized protein n=1 Tax=Caerostris extrusa TaxID=172846 RepID=A0AAV4WRR1_CAEEX|nr:hypothetical protein CEXT_783141 [Caerostris extrusa]
MIGHERSCGHASPVFLSKVLANTQNWRIWATENGQRECRLSIVYCRTIVFQAGGFYGLSVPSMINAMIPFTQPGHSTTATACLSGENHFHAR